MDQQQITAEWLAAQESFQQYCTGLDGKDKVEWELWINDHPEWGQEVDEARQIVLSLSGQVSSTEIEDELSRFHQSIQTRTVPLGRSRRVWIMRIAAAVLVLLACYWGWEQMSPAPQQWASTTYGEIQALQLPDGSTLQLNANSKAHFAANWDDAKQREVWIEGQAFFDVVHNPDMPFIVHTAKGDVKVLGTSFDVLNRPGAVKVTLVDGSVQFLLPKKAPPVSLRPGEQIQIVQDTLSKHLVETGALTAWRHGRLEYKNTPISEIIHELEYNYGWSVAVDDPVLLERKVTAKVPESDPGLLLEAISVLYDLEVTKLGKGNYRIE